MGFKVQILGEIQLNPDPVLSAHIVRDFSGVDPEKYHRAIAVQVPFCPLNVNRKRKHSEEEEFQFLTCPTEFESEKNTEVTESKDKNHEKVNESSDIFDTSVCIRFLIIYFEWISIIIIPRRYSRIKLTRRRQCLEHFSHNKKPPRMLWMFVRTKRASSSQAGLVSVFSSLVYYLKSNILRYFLAVFKVFTADENGLNERLNLRSGRHINLNYSCNDVVWNQLEDTLLATAATNGAVVLWNLGKPTSSKQLHIFMEHKRTVNKVIINKMDAGQKSLK